MCPEPALTRELVTPPRPELRRQIPLAAIRLREEGARKAFGVHLLLAGVFDQHVVHAFEADGMVRQHFGEKIGALENIAAGDDQRHPFRALDQTTGRFEHRDAGSFRADQRACHMKAVFREKKSRLYPETRRGMLGNI